MPGQVWAVHGIQKVWLAVPLKIKANGEGQGECRLQKKIRGGNSADTRLMTLATLAAAGQQREERERERQAGMGHAAATSCGRQAGLYKHDLSN